MTQRAELKIAYVKSPQRHRGTENSKADSSRRCAPRDEIEEPGFLFQSRPFLNLVTQCLCASVVNVIDFFHTILRYGSSLFAGPL